MEPGEAGKAGGVSPAKQGTWWKWWILPGVVLRDALREWRHALWNPLARALDGYVTWMCGTVRCTLHHLDRLGQVCAAGSTGSWGLGWNSPCGAKGIPSELGKGIQKVLKFRTSQKYLVLFGCSIMSSTYRLFNPARKNPMPFTYHTEDSPLSSCHSRYLGCPVAAFRAPCGGVR